MTGPARRRPAAGRGSAGRGPAGRRAAVGLLVTWVLLSHGPLALAATPSPGAGGDPRSPGEGPGLVGEPLLALGIVAAIALASVVVTLLWLRATEGR